MNQSFKNRLATLERLEAAEQPALPPYVCMHLLDAAALDNPATPAAVRAQIVAAYQLGGSQQKLYIGLCSCDWDGDGRSCRVCANRPVVQVNTLAYNN